MVMHLIIYLFAKNKNKNALRQEDIDKIMNILDGGRKSFSNRNKKYGNVLGEEEYGNN